MASTTWLHRLALGVALPLAVLTVPGSQAAEPKPAAAPAQTETDAAKAVRYTRALESAPLADEALEMRRWLLRWIVETPDYSVTVCNMLDLRADDRPALADELLLQMMAGNVAWQIEHGAGTDEAPRQLAAVESVLRMYGNYLVKDAKWVVPALEPLIVQQRAGTLREYVEKKTADACSSEGGEPMTLSDEQDAAPFLGGYLRESHVVYPLKVPTGWEMLSEHRYDELEYGASVRFHRVGDESGWMDVYFYPMGVLNTEQVAQLAASERNNLVAAWKESFTDTPLSPLSTFSVPLNAAVSVPAGRQPRPSAVTAYEADFTYIHKENGKRYHSAMVFMVDRLYAIKLRYSAEAAKLSRAQARKEAENFARYLLPQLDITSTGNCGVPELTENGRMADGCAGQDPIQPAVLEGRRELRFEYPSSR